MTHTSERVTALHLALIALPLLLMVVTVVLLVGSLFDWNPLWPRDDFNMSEQAALKNRAGILERLENGENPNLARVVRAGLIRSHPMTVTPIEVAVATRETWLVQFMLDHGALVTDENRERLVCIARDVGANDVEQMISQGKLVDCIGIQTPWK